MNAILLSAIFGITLMFLSAFKPSIKSYTPFAIIGFLLLLAANVLEYNGISIIKFNTKGMLLFTKTSLVFSIVTTACAIIYLLLNASHIEKVGKHKAEYFVLLFFIFCGIYVVLSYASLLMLFLGIEIISIPLYVLTSSDKENLKSNEAGLKYFLMGAFSSAILLLGMAFVFGGTGSFELDKMNVIYSKVLLNDGAIHPGIGAWASIGCILMFAALAFKVSAAPFHFWTPDVYDGAPTVFTSFMATIVKAALFLAFMKLFHDLFGIVQYKWMQFALIVIILTLIIGNVTAIFQQSVKRMLAYSSIAQAGFMLFGVVALNTKAYEGMLLYTIAYSLATVAIFTVLLHLKDYTFDGFNGLAKKQPILAATTTISLLSLAGIPLTAGFFAKYYMLTAALQANVHLLVIVVAIIGAAISVYYYFRVIQAMYFKDGSPEIAPVEPSTKYTLIVTAIIIILLGILPEMATSWL